VRTAFHEVSSVLTGLEKRAQAEAKQARAVTASTDAVQIAHRRYRSGLASYYEVLEAQQLLLPAETQLAQIRATRLSTSVQLYKQNLQSLRQHS
jgi:outer membrane protein TolC